MAENQLAQKKYPTLPGVYLMKDREAVVIYVGKALNLKSRLKSYFSGADERMQIRFLMDRVAAIETIVCRNEEEALILESDLIKKYQPRYNIRLKDDKSYLSVRVDLNAEWPRLTLVRKIFDDGAKYFGPYTNSYELRKLLDVIRSVIPLRTCTDATLYNRQRPCLEYQIKRCLAPCCLNVDRDEYAELVKEAISILKGNTKETATRLVEKMEVASTELRFEEAAALRDRASILKDYADDGRSPVSFDDQRDVFGIYRQGEQVAITVLRIENGRISDTVNFSLDAVQIDTEAVLESAVQQFYESGRRMPDEVVLPFVLQNGSMFKNITFTVPERGSKFHLVELANINAEQYFNSSFDSIKLYQKVAEELSVLLKLKQMPRRIECVDISNFQGSDVVGAIVTFFDGVPATHDYRQYKLSHRKTPDDFASIYEVVKRRLEKGIETGELPDLLIIDGGRGQLNAAIRAREELRIAVDIASLAKDPERLFSEWDLKEKLMPETSDVTHFLQRIRDEVHRFVITFHRKTRAKRVQRSVLDEISGLGPERKRRLMKTFGTLQKIKAASLDEIAKAGRMPKSLAEKIKKAL